MFEGALEACAQGLSDVYWVSAAALQNRTALDCLTAMPRMRRTARAFHMYDMLEACLRVGRPKPGSTHMVLDTFDHWEGAGRSDTPATCLALHKLAGNARCLLVVQLSHADRVFSAAHPQFTLRVRCIDLHYTFVSVEPLLRLAPTLTTDWFDLGLFAGLHTPPPQEMGDGDGEDSAWDDFDLNEEGEGEEGRGEEGVVEGISKPPGMWFHIKAYDFICKSGASLFHMSCLAYENIC